MIDLLKVSKSGAIQIAQKMLSQAMSAEQIQAITGLSYQEIESLRI